MIRPFYFPFSVVNLFKSGPQFHLQTKRVAQWLCGCDGAFHWADINSHPCHRTISISERFRHANAVSGVGSASTPPQYAPVLL